MPTVISDVVDQRDHHRPRELQLEAERDVGRDEEQRDDDREDRALGDLTAEARRHALDARLPLERRLEALRQARLLGRL